MIHNTPDTVRSLWVSILMAIRAGAAAQGYGCTLGRVLRIRPNFGDMGILGLLCLGILGITIHFVAALSTAVGTVVLVIGLLLAVAQWREIKAASALRPWAVAGIFLVMLLHAQALPQFQSDMAGYHLQSLRWDREFAIIPGLGNLHGRLAFNSVVILIAALTDDAGTRWIVNLLIGTFFWISVFSRLQSLRSFQAGQATKPRRQVEYWFLTLVLAATAVVPRLWGETWAMNADIVAAYLVMYWVVLVLGYERSDRPTTVVLLILSSSLAMTAKISTAPLIAFTVVFVGMRFEAYGAYLRRASVVAGLLLIAWLSRSMLLSGCALYPVRQTCAFTLPWAESPDMVYDESISIRSWARLEWEGHFTRALGNWNWVGPWIKANRRQPLVELLLLGATLGLVALLFRRSVRQGISGDVGLTCIALAGSLLFWFVAAPDVRFGAGFLFSAAVLGMSIACAAWLKNPRLYSHVSTMLSVLLAIGGLIAVRTLLVRPDYNRFRIPEAAVYQVRIADRQSVWVPVTGSSCWDHSLPCTPYVDPVGIAKVRTSATSPYWGAAAAPPPGWKAQRSVNPYPEERHSEERSR